MKKCNCNRKPCHCKKTAPTAAESWASGYSKSSELTPIVRSKYEKISKTINDIFQKEARKKD